MHTNVCFVLHLIGSYVNILCDTCFICYLRVCGYLFLFLSFLFAYWVGSFIVLHRNATLTHFYFLFFIYTGTYILLCNWNADKLECTVQPGYKFDQASVASTLDVHIPSVQPSMAGMYVCQLVPDDSIPVTTCHLNVTGKTTKTHSKK
jgi:hypothetical protein